MLAQLSLLKFRHIKLRLQCGHGHGVMTKTDNLKKKEVTYYCSFPFTWHIIHKIQNNKCGKNLNGGYIFAQDSHKLN